MARRKLYGCAVLMHEAGREYHVRIRRHGRDCSGVYTEIENEPLRERRTPMAGSPFCQPIAVDDAWPFKERVIRVHRSMLRACEKH